MRDFYARIPSECEDAIAFLTERAQAEADARADAIDKQRERIESEVDFSDLLEELAGSFDVERRIAFMDSLAKDECEVVIAMMQNAKSRIVERRLAKEKQS